MAENSIPSSSSPKPLIEATNSQQLQQSLTSPLPSLDHQQQQMVQQQTVQSQQQQLQQLQQHIQNNSSNVNISNNSSNFIGVSNFQGLQRNASVSRINQLQQNSNIGNQLEMIRQHNSGIYGQMNFGGMNVMQQQLQQTSNNSQVIMNNTISNNQQQIQLQQQQIGQQNQLHQSQIGQQNQLQQQQIGQPNQLQQQQIGQQNQLQQQIGQQQQMGQMGVGNLSRSALIGQTSHLPMLSGQAGAASGQFNLQNQFLSSPRQKAGFMQASQFQLGNSPGQSLQGMQAMGMTGSLNLSSQLRPNGTLAYNQQRIISAQLRQHLTQHNALTANQILQGQNIARTSLLNGQISGQAQNGQTAAIMQNLSRQQWLKQQMPSMSSPNSPAHRLHQQRQLVLQQQFVASQLNQNSLGPNTQQLSPTVQQQAQTQMHQLKQQQPSQQLLNQQQSPRMEAPGGQKPALIGSQPDAATLSGAATPGGSSSQGTEASNQLLGKRKIQDLADQLGGNVKLDPEVQDFLLEFADNFLDSVTKFVCTLAKHRKSSTLETKDVLLHLEKNWNLKVPGFSTEDRKHKPDHPPSDAHKKRLDAIRTSMEPVQSEPNNTSKQMMIRQGSSNSVGPSQMIRLSPSSEQLISQSAMPQMLQQTTRF